MAFLAAALPYIAAAGTLVSTVGAIQQGKAAQTSANFQAAQAKQQAGQERASAQRIAIGERHKAELVSSRAKALAAASGGGASDPTVTNIIGDINTQGEYNAMSALYGGEERARGLEMGAQAKQMEGVQARNAGYMQAASTIAQYAGNQSLMQKYSPDYSPGEEQLLARAKASAGV